jgi:uncharacterized protein YndB with AHSA1/START domain
MSPTESLNVTTPTDREIVVTRTFDATRRLVFDCLTKPELVRRWLLGPPGWTMPVCEIDLRVGGRYRYVWRQTSGREMGMGGIYREIVRPERIVTAELFDEDWTGGETLVTAVLTAEGGKTTLTTTILYSSKEARDSALGTGMTEGMSAGYNLMEELLASMAAGEAR